MAYDSQPSGIVDYALHKTIYNGMAGNGVVSGIEASVTGSSLVVTLTAGSVVSDGSTAVYAGGTETLSAGDATNPRMDSIIWDDSAGDVAVLQGVPTAESATQTRPPLRDLEDENDFLLWVQYVPAGATVLLSSNLFDRRVMVQGGLVASSDTPVATTSTSQVDLVAITGLSIPVTSKVILEYGFSKDALAASEVKTGFKVNATEVREPVMATTATQQVEDGVVTVALNPRTAATAGGVLITYFTKVTATGATGTAFTGATALTAVQPVATITSLTITGINTTNNNNLTVEWYRVWELPV